MTRISNIRIKDRFKGEVLREWEMATCIGKETFESPQMAAKVAKRRKHPGRHYRCPCCGKYHIEGSRRRIK